MITDIILVMNDQIVQDLLGGDAERKQEQEQRTDAATEPLFSIPQKNCHHVANIEHLLLAGQKLLKRWITF
jgi:hypothetical protein